MVDHGDEFPQIVLDAKVQGIFKWKAVVCFVDQSIRVYSNYSLPCCIN